MGQGCSLPPPLPPLHRAPLCSTVSRTQRDTNDDGHDSEPKTVILPPSPSPPPFFPIRQHPVRPGAVCSWASVSYEEAVAKHIATCLAASSLTNPSLKGCGGYGQTCNPLTPTELCPLAWETTVNSRGPNNKPWRCHLTHTLLWTIHTVREGNFYNLNTHVRHPTEVEVAPRRPRPGWDGAPVDVKTVAHLRLPTLTSSCWRRRWRLRMSSSYGRNERQ